MEDPTPTGRSVLVTGAFGFLGAWLVRALLEAGNRVVTVRRDRPATTPLGLLGLADRLDVVPGDIREEGLVSRTLNEYEVHSVFHLAAQPLVGIATMRRCPRSRPTSGARGWCWKQAGCTASAV